MRVMTFRASARRAAALTVPVLLAAIVAGCETAHPIQGTVRDKYIEDFTEYTVVVETAAGVTHHFTIDADDWSDIRPGQAYNSDDYRQTTDD